MEMKAVVLKNPYEIEIEKRPIPVPGEGSVLLETQYGGICGSDVACFVGNFYLKMYPVVQGHEFSAKIASVNPNNKFGLKEGMVVTGLPYFGCGKCASCLRGFPQVCRENKTVGTLQDGGFQQYLTLPEFRVHDCTGIDPAVAALVEPLVIGLHGAKRPGINEGDKVLVIGAGTIGLVTAIMAKQLGGEVTITDVVESKINTAVNEFGIHHGFLNDDPDKFVERCLEATGGEGYEVVMDCVGSVRTFVESMTITQIGGSIVSIGVGHSNADFDYKIIMQKHLNVYGSRNGTGDDFRDVIAMLRDNKLGDMTKMITKIYPYAEATEAMTFVKDNNDKVIKVLLKLTD